jgi:hypothetical protein
LTPANKQKPLGDISGLLSLFGAAGFRTVSAAADSKGEFDAQNIQMALTHAPGRVVYGPAFSHCPGTGTQSGSTRQKEDQRDTSPGGAISAQPA